MVVAVKSYKKVTIFRERESDSHHLLLIKLEYVLKEVWKMVEIDAEWLGFMEVALVGCTTE